MNLNVELITGDVNKVDGIDFLLIGHKNPLREQICRETGSLFKAVDSESWMFPHKYELLEVPSYKWKQVAAIKFRANGKISETRFVRISSPIATALKKPQIESIGILPPTWRNPEYCALGVIYSLWIVGYSAASAAKSFYPDMKIDLCGKRCLLNLMLNRHLLPTRQDILLKLMVKSAIALSTNYFTTVCFR